jgi:hypothetical protein
MNNVQTSQFRDELCRLFPDIPDNVLRAVVDRERARIENGRLGFSSFAPLALAAVAGYIRHHLTHYNNLLATGRHTRNTAREAIRHDVQRYEASWGRA